MFFEIFLPLVGTVGLRLRLSRHRRAGGVRRLRDPRRRDDRVLAERDVGMASQLFWEKETGNLALYIMAPNSLMAILLGMALGGMFNDDAARARDPALGSWLFDVSFAVDQLPAARRRSSC